MKFKAIALSLALAAYAIVAWATESSGALVSATFTPLSGYAPVLNNPGRGVATIGYNDMANTESSVPINNSDIAGGGRNAICYIDLINWVGGASIPSANLTHITNNFTNIRANGESCLLMIVYGTFTGTDPGVTLSVITNHLAQLRPILWANADVIPYARAGMFGAYGQWFNNPNGLTCGVSPSIYSCPSATVKANQTQVLNLLMAAYHPLTQVNVPDSAFLYQFWPTPVNATTAFTGSVQARTGGDDDCPLSSAFGTGQSIPTGIDDDAYFTDYIGLGLSTAQLTAYAHSQSEYTPTTGEVSGGCPNPYVTCAQALAYWPYFHPALFKLIAGDADPWTNSWSSGGCAAQIYSQMGYRLQLDSISHQGTALHGQTVSFTVNMRNTGWGRDAHPHKVHVQLVNGGTTIDCASRVDMRSLPDQATSSFSVTIDQCLIPTAGTYTVYLRIPPVWPSLYGNPLYYIRPAVTNTGAQVWDNVNARIPTGTQIVVS